MLTYYTGSTSASSGYFKRLSPAIPNTVWKTSTISPGRSASPPSSGSYRRQDVLMPATMITYTYLALQDEGGQLLPIYPMQSVQHG
jgi:hypothetical protein